MVFGTQKKVLHYGLSMIEFLVVFEPSNAFKHKQVKFLQVIFFKKNYFEMGHV
jgi:hypothetical protein